MLVLNGENFCTVRPQGRMVPHFTNEWMKFARSVDEGREMAHYISSISDDTLLRVLSKFEEKGKVCSNSLVSKKWLNLGGRLVRKVKVCDWEFVKSGRILLRFSHVVDVDVDLILKLVGNVDGFYSSLVSDIWLTILAQGCKRMDDGWLSSVSYCENLKSLRLVSCKRIDGNPGLDEHLGSCRMLERLHMERCQLRDKESLRAVFLGAWRGKWGPLVAESKESGGWEE
ncbi:F-box protein-like protein [Tanacetum coccineum]